MNEPWVRLSSRRNGVNKNEVWDRARALSRLMEGRLAIQETAIVIS